MEGHVARGYIWSCRDDIGHVGSCRGYIRLYGIIEGHLGGYIHVYGFAGPEALHRCRVQGLEALLMISLWD